MSDKEKEELDISASFTVEPGVSSDVLTAAVEELAGESFQKKLVLANDYGKWYEIGNGSKDPTKQCIILGNDNLIRDGETYSQVTVKYKPSSKSGREHSTGCGDFAESVLRDIREFRDKLKDKLVPKKPAKKK